MIESIYKEGFSVLRKLIDSPFVFTDDLILEEEFKLANAEVKNPSNTVKLYFFIVQYNIGVREFLVKLGFKHQNNLSDIKGKDYSYDTHVLVLLNHVFHVSVVDNLEHAKECQDLYLRIQKNTNKSTDIDKDNLS